MRLNRLLFITLTFIFASAFELNIYAQDYNFAWINNPGAGDKLKEAVNFINDSTDARFVIVTGGFSEFSDTGDFENARSALAGLNIPFYVIPGNKDIQWSGNKTGFINTFDDDRFAFEFENEKFIGFSTAIHWRGDGGHAYPENLSWLKEQLQNLNDGQQVYLILSNPLKEVTDNWYEITNLLAGRNIQAIMCGGGNENKLLNINQIPGLINKPFITDKKDEWNLTLCRNTQDSLIFFDVTKTNLPTKWKTVTKNIHPEIERIEPAQFDSLKCGILLNIETEATLIAKPLYHNGFIYTADYSGLITCYDSAGNVTWDYDAFGNITGNPVIADNIFTAATLQGDLITLNAFTGEQIQTIGFDDEISSSLITIEYTGNKSLLLPKFTESKTAVILGTAAGQLSCYDLETLQEYWINTSANGRITTKPVHIDNKIIFGCRDGYLYCIDSREGWLIWKWTTGNDKQFSPAGCKPVTDGKNVYVTTTDHKLYAVDLQLGKTVWKSKKYKCWESIGFNHDRVRVLLKNTDGTFNIIETKKGRNRKTIKIGYKNDKTPVSPFIWEDSILTAAGNGYIYIIDKKFNAHKLLFSGTAAINSLQFIEDNIFLASDIDGRVILFKIN